jgi:hypothetical protein
MLKQIIFKMNLVLLFMGLFSIALSAQEILCEYAGRSKVKTITLSEAPEGADDRIKEILNVVGLSGNFNVKVADINNAAAMIYGSERYVLFNPQYLQAVYKRAGTRWTTYSILAHEIGHHLNGHTIGSKKTSHECELEADEFSGFVLGRLGATREEAMLAMAISGSSSPTHTHPDKGTRMKAIAMGWNRARTQP